jgi:glycosyltransferase involved in cell wall biosynthesis
MISLIVCSRSKADLIPFTANVEQTIGVEYELIAIDNSENEYSIFSAYNEGIRLSKGDYLCFVHEDVQFHSKGWGENLTRHLQLPEVGIVGLAGGGIVSRIPDSWKNKHSAINIIQSDRKTAKAARKVTLPVGNTYLRREVILLDGVFLAMNRNVAEKVKFDETLGGFHGYDLDICMQAVTDGFRNFVVYDIELEHFSRGGRDKKYFANLIAIFRKWENSLPILLTEIEPKVEKKQLYRLLYKLISRGFSKPEVVEQIVYFGIKSKASFLLQRKCIVAVFYFLIQTFLSAKKLFH